MRVRPGAGVALAAALVLVVGACSEPGAPAEPDTSSGSSSTAPAPEPGASPSETGGTTSSVPVADPAHAVDPPGARDGRLWSADILVQWDRPIDDELLDAIKDLKGVAHTE